MLRRKTFVFFLFDKKMSNKNLEGWIHELFCACFSFEQRKHLDVFEDQLSSPRAWWEQHFRSCADTEQGRCLDSGAVCWCRLAVFVVHEEQMALLLTPMCIFLSPSWTAAQGGALSGQTGQYGGEGFEDTLVWRCNQAACCRAADPALTSAVREPSLAFFCCWKRMKRERRTQQSSLDVAGAAEASGYVSRLVRTVSRRALHQVKNLRDKTLCGIYCKFSTLDRNINRDYLKRQADPGGPPRVTLHMAQTTPLRYRFSNKNFTDKKRKMYTHSYSVFVTILTTSERILVPDSNNFSSSYSQLFYWHSIVKLFFFTRVSLHVKPRTGPALPDLRKTNKKILRPVFIQEHLW